MTRRPGSDVDAEIADLKADFLARLEWGLNPAVAHSGEHSRAALPVSQNTKPCENGNGPGGAGNTTRSLTHSSGTSREGLGSW